jgi:hypothetical protein
VVVQTTDLQALGAYYHLVLITTPSKARAMQVYESLDTLKAQARVMELRHPEVRTVYKVALGRFLEPYHTFRLRSWFGLRDDQFVDAYTEKYTLP